MGENNFTLKLNYSSNVQCTSMIPSDEEKGHVSSLSWHEEIQLLHWVVYDMAVGLFE